MSELQVSLVFSVIIWVNVIREKLPYFFSLRVAEGTLLFFADASILVRGNKSVPGSVRPTSYSLLFTNFADI